MKSSHHFGLPCLGACGVLMLRVMKGEPQYEQTNPDQHDPIRDLRNHIAHGHLLVRHDEATKKLVMTLSLPKNLDAAYSPDSRHLGFDALERASSGLTELIDEFRQLTRHPSRNGTGKL